MQTWEFGICSQWCLGITEAKPDGAPGSIMVQGWWHVLTLSYLPDSEYLLFKGIKKAKNKQTKIHKQPAFEHHNIKLSRIYSPSNSMMGYIMEFHWALMKYDIMFRVSGVFGIGWRKACFQITIPCLVWVLGLQTSLSMCSFKNLLSWHLDR